MSSNSTFDEYMLRMSNVHVEWLECKEEVRELTDNMNNEIILDSNSRSIESKLFHKRDIKIEQNDRSCFSPTVNIECCVAFDDFRIAEHEVQ